MFINEMLKKTTIEEMKLLGSNIADNSMDIYTGTNNIRFLVKEDKEINKNIASIAVKNDDDPSTLPVYQVNDWALHQMSLRHGVPYSYLTRCVEKQPKLAAENMNTWLKDAPGNGDSNVFLRLHDNRLRGYLTQKYAVCDSPDIIDLMDEVMNENNFSLRSGFISEERLHMRFVAKEMLDMPQVDDLFPMITVNSSDIGRCSLHVTFGIFKLVCTNGLTIEKAHGELYRQKHLGLTSEEFYSDLVRNVRFGLPEMIDGAKNMVISAQNKPISPDDIENLIKRTRKELTTSGEVEDEIRNIIPIYGNNRWGFINALTEVAQKYSLEKRLDYERFAGRLLTLSAAA